MGFFSSEHEVGALSRQVASLSAQVERLSSVVELLARRQGVSDAELAAFEVREESWVTEARHLKATQGPVRAIRLVRERTGKGLREAKEIVDGL